MPMRKIEFTTQGTCSRKIEIKLEDDVVHEVKFQGGCVGNHQAISALVRGRKIWELISLLQGIQCQNGTSCPDQLAKALKDVQPPAPK
jgi:uncharacterized protein (TIGR03905 family)